MFLEKAIATFFGSGYFPLGPGTAGSLLALVLWWLVLCPPLLSFNAEFVPIFAIIICVIAGTWATSRLENVWGKDPSKIVIDEAIGMWITLLFVPCQWVYVLIAFILFRFFDIVKPLGIRKTENYLGAFGVILDDIVAGIYAWLVLRVIIYFQLFG